MLDAWTVQTASSRGGGGALLQQKSPTKQFLKLLLKTNQPLFLKQRKSTACLPFLLIFWPLQVASAHAMRISPNPPPAISRARGGCKVIQSTSMRQIMLLIFPKETIAFLLLQCKIPHQGKSKPPCAA